MSARNIRSTAMSTSVTRSIVPFLSTRRSPPKRAICMSPARTTASMAVVRKSGLNIGRSPNGERSNGGWSGLDGSVGGASGLHAFDHADFHAAFRHALQLHVVHEVADQENAAAAGFQEVFGSERVGHFFGVEAFALVANADAQFGSGFGCGGFELDEHMFGRVVPVAMLDGVDHRLAHRNADPVERVFVEADASSHVIAHNLYEIDHFEDAVEFEPDRPAAVRRHAP